MPRPQPTPSESPEPITGPSADDADHFRAALREVVDHGVEITRSIAAQAKADPVPHPFWGNKVPVPYPTEHLTTCYDRTARSIRRSIALALTLHHLPARAPRPLAAAPPAAPPAANDEHPRPAKIAAQPAPKSDACEPPDRPDRPDWDEPGESELFAADAARPVDDVIHEIRLSYAAQGHPILSPIPQPKPPLPPKAQAERTEPGAGRVQTTAGGARTAPPPARSPTPHPSNINGPLLRPIQSSLRGRLAEAIQCCNR